MNIDTRITNLRRCLARTDDTATRDTLRSALLQAEAARDAKLSSGKVSSLAKRRIPVLAQVGAQVDHNYCCQCKDLASGSTGCFVFAKERPFVAISPVFGGLVELYAWMRSNGWACVHELNEPWGAVRTATATHTSTSTTSSTSAM